MAEHDYEVSDLLKKMRAASDPHSELMAKSKVLRILGPVMMQLPPESETKGGETFEEIITDGLSVQSAGEIEKLVEWFNFMDHGFTYKQDG